MQIRILFLAAALISIAPADEILRAFDQEASRALVVIANKHIGLATQAQQAAMKSGDLNAANSADKTRRAIIKNRTERAIQATRNNVQVPLIPTITVPATANSSNPKPTGIAIKAGDKFIVLPKLADRWFGRSSREGESCDFMGYPKRKDQWMRLFYQIGDTKPQPVPSNFKIVPEDSGLLYFYAEDKNSEDNTGQIQVQILIENKVYQSKGR